MYRCPKALRVVRNAGPPSVRDLETLAVHVLEYRDPQDEEEQDHSLGRGVSEVVSLESVPVEVQDHDIG